MVLFPDGAIWPIFDQIMVVTLFATSSTSLACTSSSSVDKNSKTEHEVRVGIFIESTDSLKESGDGRYCDQILMV